MASARNVWHALFGRERSSWAFANLVLALIAIRKGFSQPNLWAATQAQIDYGEGFVKRGLFGAALSRPFHLEHFSRFASVSTALLILFFLTLFAFAKWAGVEESFTRPGTMAVFSASFVVTYFAGLNGYFDLPIAVLTMGVLFLESATVRLFAAVPVTVVALLTHEIFLFTFFPLLMLSFVIQEFRPESRHDQHKMVRVGVPLLLVLALGVTMALSLRAPLQAQSMHHMEKRISGLIDFQPNIFVFPLLSKSAKANAREMFSIVHGTWWKRRAFAGFLAFAPVIAFLLYQIVQIVRSRGSASTRWLLPIALTSGLFPLCLNALGWDVDRWFALCGLTSFLVLCILCRYLPGPPVHLPISWTPLALLLVAVGMATGGPLINGTPATPYPFFDPNVPSSAVAR